MEKISKRRNDRLTVSNYDDVSKNALITAMNGIFPKKETDFMRLCRPDQLSIGDMLALLKEDYPNFTSDPTVYSIVHSLLSESDLCHRSFAEIRAVLDAAGLKHCDKDRLVMQLKELSFRMLGRDIFKREIGIVDGHNGSSYFWIMPVRVIDFSNTNDCDNVAEMRSAEISIEEDDVAQYLTPFLDARFDDELEANKQRAVRGFEWYLTHHFLPSTQ